MYKIIIGLFLGLFLLLGCSTKTIITINGGPFRRNILYVSIEYGVQIIEDTKTPFRHIYDPSHPDAIIDGTRRGFVVMPNVDILIEMTDMIATSFLFVARV